MATLNTGEERTIRLLPSEYIDSAATYLFPFSSNLFSPIFSFFFAFSSHLSFLCCIFVGEYVGQRELT